MKTDIYTVRGTSGPDKTEPVRVAVGDDGAGNWTAAFVFRGISCVYRPRAMSPYPERVQPPRMHMDVQPVTRSIAQAAFAAARKAAQEDARIAEIDSRAATQEHMALDDIALGGIARRSMGVVQ